jgi:hypothetical protein
VAAVSLDFAAQHPERLRSLAIYEPARQPGPLVLADHPEYAAARERLSPDEMMAAFTSLQLRPGVEPPPPPPGPAPDWMAKRPEGLRAMMRAFAVGRQASVDGLARAPVHRNVEDVGAAVMTGDIEEAAATRGLVRIAIGVEDPLGVA